MAPIFKLESITIYRAKLIATPWTICLGGAYFLCLSATCRPTCTEALEAELGEVPTEKDSDSGEPSPPLVTESFYEKYIQDACPRGSPHLPPDTKLPS